MHKQRTVGILLYDDVEVLDFAGPFEVFSLATLQGGHKPFQVRTISETGNMIVARNGLKVVPDFGFDDAPDFEVVIIPGGYGAEEVEINNPAVISWIQKQYTKVEILASVCTGALLLAKAGLLDRKSATTHWLDIGRLEREFPHVKVIRNTKYIDEGRIITAAGISAGINMSFHVVKRLLGAEIAQATAERMEYDIAII